jgi:small subunit ribosomal protein S15
MQMGTAKKTERKEKTAQLVTTFGSSQTDTGSTSTQIALITNRINTLTPHFQKNAKDHHSRVGLLRLVGQRRKLLKYLKAKDEAQYMKVLSALELRK